MSSKNIRSALAHSMSEEKQAVTNRFEKAEAILGKPPSQREVPVERVIRDTFTLPESDYQLIGELREKCLKARKSVTKSEVMRAGLHALRGLSEAELLAVFGRLVKLRTGRPARVS